MHIISKNLLRAVCKLFIYSFEFYVVSKNTLCSKGFTSFGWKKNLVLSWKKIVTMIPTKLLLQISYKIAFISFLFSRRIQKQESNFWRVGDGLVTRNISVFYF